MTRQMRDVMRDVDLTYKMVMRDAKKIRRLYNTLYVPNFSRVTQGGKSMRDVRDFLRDRVTPAGDFRILLGCGVTRHAVAILAKKKIRPVFQIF